MENPSGFEVESATETLLISKAACKHVDRVKKTDRGSVENGTRSKSPDSSRRVAGTGNQPARQDRYQGESKGGVDAEGITKDVVCSLATFLWSS